jgi:hypothetical protein
VLVLVLVLEELVPVVELLLLLLELLLLLLLEPELLRPLPSLVLLRRCSAPSLLLLASLLYRPQSQYLNTLRLWYFFAFTQRMKMVFWYFWGGTKGGGALSSTHESVTDDTHSHVLVQLNVWKIRTTSDRRALGMEIDKALASSNKTSQTDPTQSYERSGILIFII